MIRLGYPANAPGGVFADLSRSWLTRNTFTTGEPENVSHDLFCSCSPVLL